MVKVVFAILIATQVPAGDVQNAARLEACKKSLEKSFPKESEKAPSVTEIACLRTIEANDTRYVLKMDVGPCPECPKSEVIRKNDIGELLLVGTVAAVLAAVAGGLIVSVAK